MCFSPELKASLEDIIGSAGSEGLEGSSAAVALSRASGPPHSGRCESIEGRSLSSVNFDALIFGYYSGGKLARDISITM